MLLSLIQWTFVGALVLLGLGIHLQSAGILTAGIVLGACIPPLLVASLIFGDRR